MNDIRLDTPGVSRASFIRPMMRTVIVDDERLAREGLKMRLRAETDIELVGEASDGPGAVKIIERQSPDLLFLDVRMPGLSGFQVLNRLGRTAPRAVIIVSAFENYALKAFDAQVLDYLLKPINEERLRTAVQRARMAITRQQPGEAPRMAVDVARPATPDSPRPQFLQRLAVRVRDRFLMLRIDEVDWVESAANYVQLHARGRSFLVRMTMNELEAKLDAERFTRIHRSTIVNVDRLVEVRPSPHGDFEVTLQDGTRLRLSRGYRDQLLN
jgi:two-component system LytT family response regulator